MIVHFVEHLKIEHSSCFWEFKTRGKEISIFPVFWENLKILFSLSFLFFSMCMCCALPVIYMQEYA